MRLIFIRHAEPDYSIDSLTEKGWREAIPYPDAGTAAEKRQGRYNSLAGTAGA